MIIFLLIASLLQPASQIENPDIKHEYHLRYKYHYLQKYNEFDKNEFEKYVTQYSQEQKIMTSICSVCKCIIKVETHKNTLGVSHGYCVFCAKKEYKKLKLPFPKKYKKIEAEHKKKEAVVLLHL